MNAGLIPVTLADMRAELCRELAMRRHVYRRQVAEHRLTQQRADWQIAVLEAVLQLVEREAAA